MDELELEFMMESLELSFWLKIKPMIKRLLISNIRGKKSNPVVVSVVNSIILDLL
jgi:hypothetical protein